jgi:predicted transcriptional regulator
MGDPFDAVAYLARSENRVAILRALNERPRDRRDLEEGVGVSRSTLSRVLRELEEEHGWIRRRGDEYSTTMAGSLVVERFVPLLETVSALDTLEGALAYLPVEEMSIDVRHFHDAEFIGPDEFDPTAPFEYGVGRVRDSTVLRSVGQVVPPAYVRALHEDVENGDLDLEIVLGREYLDAVSDSDLSRLWADTATESTVLAHDGHVPYNLLVLDDVVHVWLCSEEGEQAGLLESENPAVRQWAQSTVDDYLEEGRQLAPGTLA